MFRIVRADRLKMLEAVHAMYCGLVLAASRHQTMGEAVGAFLALGGEYRKASGGTAPQFQVLSTSPPVEGHIVGLFLVGTEDGGLGLSKAGAEEALRRFQTTGLQFEYLLGLLADSAKAMADDLDARLDAQWSVMAGWIREALAASPSPSDGIHSPE